MAVGHLVKTDRPIENAARFDASFEHGRQEFAEVSAHGSRTAADGDVL